MVLMGRRTTSGVRNSSNSITVPAIQLEGKLRSKETEPPPPIMGFI
jgi:hypothetical protein